MQTAPTTARRFGVLVLLTVALVPGAARQADAATIELSVTSRATASPRGVRIDLLIRNDGDSPAVNVLPIVDFRGAEVLGTFLPLLTPANSANQEVSIEVPEGQQLRGTWPFFVHVSYSDTNNHPFEGLHVGTVTFQTAGPRLVDLRLSGTRLDTTGEITAFLESRISASVALTFLAPAGLAVTPEQATVPLSAGRRRVTAFLTNAGATESSRLPVFAIAEYDAGKEHGTAVAYAMIAIAGPGDRRLGPVVLALGLAVALLGIAFAFARRRSRSLPF